MRATMLSDWLAQRLDRRGDQPLYRQLHGLLQRAILSRELPSGTRLPSSRLLARELDIGRNTVTQVYEQLVLEGYVSAATGRGTFVMDTSPDEIVGVTEHAVDWRRDAMRDAVDWRADARIDVLAARATASSASAQRDLPRSASGSTSTAQPAAALALSSSSSSARSSRHQVSQPEATVAQASPLLRPLSARGQRLLAGAGVSKRQWGAFMPGVPDVTRFPARVWSRLQNRYWRRARHDLLTYAPGGGSTLLRRALADYLRASRSVRCTPQQVVITTGIHQSIDLAVRLLSDAGDVIWTEDPCYWGLRSVLQVSGLQPRPIAVDHEGINPTPADLAQPPKLMLVTPSHQYPLGMVMSLARRRMLLEYARQTQCWIIEDDYDSEFRYGSRPLASLQGLDTAGQVIYVGSFGKTLFPGLRVGYIVVPEELAESFATASAELYREGQLLQQAVLAEFIAEGHFASHIRKMRTLYGQRRQILLDAAAQRFGDTFAAVGGDAGLHLVMPLPEGVDDRVVAHAALERNIVVRPLSGYYADRSHASAGLLLGYACVPDDEIAPAFDTLAQAIQATLPQFA